jgi:NAD(P)-dependent dehydrogenase (short-subunit alcohol dehydrogenase family)
MTQTTTSSALGPVIITGAASGIGFACAEQLAQVGRDVALWDIDAEKVQACASSIAEQYPVTAIGIAVDVADTEQINSAVASSRKALGLIAGLVHAAGVAGVSPLEQLTPAYWAQVMDINLRAQVFILQALLPDLKSSEGAAVVGIASINATLGNAMNPAYSASKGGMLSVTRALADDLANFGIRINTVSPGQIATPMLQQAMDYDSGLQTEFERHIMMGRLGKPEEVASAVRFLLSAEASYITATELVVDGGNIASQR